MDQPVTVFFSVIIPAYNAQKYLAGAIDSVIGQTYTDWQLIVVNDGSSDDTEAIARSYAARNPKIKLIHQTNQGLGAARNAAIREARGQWLCFLDADDRWLPGKLDAQYRLAQARPDVDVLFSDGFTKRLDEQQIRYHLKTLQGFKTGVEMYRLEMFENYIPVLSVALKRAWANRTGFFSGSSLAFGCEDHDYWLRLARGGASFYGMPEQLFYYQLHGSNMSGDVLRQNYSSANVRLDNYDPVLLSRRQRKHFHKQIRSTTDYLQAEGMAEWAGYLSERLARIGGAATPTQGAFIKRIALFILAFSLFPLKKRYELWQRRLATAYQRWLHDGRLLIGKDLKISPTAQLIFFDKEAKLSGLSLDLGDFSYINLVTKDAELTTGRNNTIHKFCNFNILGKVTLGDNILFNNYCTLNCFTAISIGDNTWMGEGVKFYDHNHRYRDSGKPIVDQGYSTGEIIIGKNVWIGSNTIILQNVTIGDGAVIGANNTIYRSVPPGTVVKSGQYTPINYE